MQTMETFLKGRLQGRVVRNTQEGLSNCAGAILNTGEIQHLKHPQPGKEVSHIEQLSDLPMQSLYLFIRVYPEPWCRGVSARQALICSREDVISPSSVLALAVRECFLQAVICFLPMQVFTLACWKKPPFHSDTLAPISCGTVSLPTASVVVASLNKGRLELLALLSFTIISYESNTRI